MCAILCENGGEGIRQVVRKYHNTLNVMCKCVLLTFAFVYGFN